MEGIGAVLGVIAIIAIVVGIGMLILPSIVQDQVDTSQGVVVVAESGTRTCVIGGQPAICGGNIFVAVLDSLAYFLSSLTSMFCGGGLLMWGGLALAAALGMLGLAFK